MNNVFDNGYSILGSAGNVKDYMTLNGEETWDVEELIHDLEKLDIRDLVVIHYTISEGYKIVEKFDYKDLVYSSIYGLVKEKENDKSK